VLVQRPTRAGHFRDGILPAFEKPPISLRTIDATGILTAHADDRDRFVPCGLGLLQRRAQALDFAQCVLHQGVVVDASRHVPRIRVVAEERVPSSPSRPGRFPGLSSSANRRATSPASRLFSSSWSGGGSAPGAGAGGGAASTSPPS